jgi:hypothetical protein
MMCGYARLILWKKGLLKIKGELISSFSYILITPPPMMLPSIVSYHWRLHPSMPGTARKHGEPSLLASRHKSCSKSIPPRPESGQDDGWAAWHHGEFGKLTNFGKRISVWVDSKTWFALLLYGQHLSGSKFQGYQVDSESWRELMEHKPRPPKSLFLVLHTVFV